MKRIFAMFIWTVSIPAMAANQPICEKLARMADTGELWGHIQHGRAPTQEEESHKIVEKYSRPSEPRIIYEIRGKTGIHKYASYLNPDWGTCSNYRIWSLDVHAGAITTPEVEVSFGKYNPDGGVDLTDAGARDELVTIDGDTFVISTYYYFDRRTLKTAAIVKNGYIDKLCEFSSEERPKLVVRKAADENLCSRIPQGELKPLPWNDDPVDSPIKNPYGTHADPDKHIVTDLNMDGKNDTLGLFEEESGGGCGSISIYLNTDDSGLNRLLHAKDDQYGQGVWGHDSYQDHNYDVHVFVDKGKPYLFGKSKLVSLWNNRLDTWCEFDSLTQHHVATVYKLVIH